MSYQDNFYKNSEADAFFKRNKKILLKEDLRKNKKKIYNILKQKINFKNKKVLEIGCFVGDFLNFIKKKHGSKIYGIEPSKLACKYAQKNYGFKIENSTFARSKFFLNNEKNLAYFDLIICDDILSWVDRNLILSTIGAIDWLLKKNGILYLKDFCPKKSIKVKNHHWKREKIYNFKQSSGHKIFFLNSGKYSKLFSKKYTSSKFQKKKSTNKQTKIWEEVILKKIATSTFIETKL